MYDGSFGLTRRPFASVPQADQYFAAATIESARTTLARCVQRGEGAGLVIGPSGTGKTLLCVLLAEQFRRSFQVVTLAAGRLSTRRALFQAILYELGRPYRYMDEGELRLAVIDHLMADEGALRGLLLLVDEAHTLPLRLLEEIRMLSNLVRKGQPLVRLVLAGGAVLEERFASPKLDSFSQRLSARCYLEAFNRSETQQYIEWQIDSAGGLGSQVFSEAACESVFQATGGIPRLINQVCDHTLLLAYVAGRKSINPPDIEEAWSDLQQLPTPWSGDTKQEATSSGVIEFGSLDDSSEPTDASSAPVAGPRVFRVASVEEDEAVEEGVAASEPSEQIHRIEQLLAEADDDFKPAGSIGPEVELCFDLADHPFREEFEQEEVVQDRYAAKGVVEKRVEKLPEQPAAPALAPAAKTISPPAAPCVSPAQPLPAAATTEVATPAAVYQRETPGSVSPAAGKPAAKRSAIAPPQRREYRQLFAQLLRG
jgi:type II secretory pathway predicted ATPase ExeA